MLVGKGKLVSKSGEALLATGGALLEDRLGLHWGYSLVGMLRMSSAACPTGLMITT